MATAIALAASLSGFSAQAQNSPEAWPAKPVKFVVPFAPAGTPKAIVDRLGRDIAAILALPDVQDKLRTLGVESDGRASETFAVFQRGEIAKWGKVIQDAGIQAE